MKTTITFLMLSTTISFAKGVYDTNSGANNLRKKEEAVSEQRAKENKQTIAILGKQIEGLHKRLNKSFKLYNELIKNSEPSTRKKRLAEKHCKGKSCIIVELDLGLTNRIGVVNRVSYEEYAVLFTSQDAVNSLSMVYAQTDIRSLLQASRTFINADVSAKDEALFDIQITHSMGPNMRKPWPIKSKPKPINRRILLGKYRDYLLKVIRAMDYQTQANSIKDSIEMKKVINLGSDT